MLIQTGYSLDDIGNKLPWGAIKSFVGKLSLDSELAREIEPDYAQWGSRLKTNVLLADIYDLLSMINANLCALGSGKTAKKPKRYPRPGDTKRDHIGKNALPAEELRAWFKKNQHEITKQAEVNENGND